MRQTWWRKWTFPALVAVTGLTLAACGGGGDDDGGTAAASDGKPVKGPVSLTFWHTMNEQEAPTLKKLVDRFEKKHPNFKINLVTVPFDQAEQKYNNAASAGKAPDVFRSEIAWTPAFAAQGFLADITDRVTDRDSYLETALGYNMFRDKIYGIPQVTDSLALLYNKRMLDSAKVGVPQTIADLTTACQKLGRGKGIFLLGNPYYALPWVYGYGGDMINADARQITISGKPAVDGIQAYKTLFDDDCAFDNGDFANDYENMQTAFKSGKVAMIVNGPWATADILSGSAFKKDPDNFGVANFPKGPGGQGSPVGGHNYVISAKSKNVDAAYQFISELNAVSNQLMFTRENQLLPTHKAAYDRPQIADDRIMSAFGAQQKIATSRPVIPEGGQLTPPTGDFAKQFQRALNGQASVGDALGQVAEDWKRKVVPDYEMAGE